MTDTTTANDRQTRIDAICHAAIPVFARQGFRGTSMADLATAAGISRPALYQYFDNRADLFRVAFGALLQAGTDAALEALAAPTDTLTRLDGYLQRLSGDGYEQLAATPHGDELMEAKHEFAADVVKGLMERNPEVIVIVNYGEVTAEQKRDFMMSNPAFADLDAVKNDRFVTLEYVEATPGPRNIQAIKTLAEAFWAD